jgi:hypothetical protein
VGICGQSGSRRIGKSFFATVSRRALFIFILGREGKKEMLHLLKYWTTMRSQDFVDLKQKLGV